MTAKLVTLCGVPIGSASNWAEALTVLENFALAMYEAKVADGRSSKLEAIAESMMRLKLKYGIRTFASADPEITSETDDSFNYLPNQFRFKKTRDGFVGFDLCKVFVETEAEAKALRDYFTSKGMTWSSYGGGPLNPIYELTKEGDYRVTYG